MSNSRKQYDKEFKKNAVQLSYASSRTVKKVADRSGHISEPAISLEKTVHATGR
jgi:transposase-like protein